MRVTKQSSSGSMQTNPVSYLLGVDNDLTNIFTVLKGRVRFGENINGNFVTVTSSATPNAEFSVTHKLGSVPQGYIVCDKDKAGDLYSSTTVATSTTLYLKATVASVTYKLFIIK